MIPLTLYESITFSKLLNDASRMTPANGSAFLIVGWVACGFGEPNAKRSATAAVTAVPRLCPTMAICEVGTLSGPAVRKFRRETPSVTRPSSVGLPVERPKPR